jgi:hypothetical protein
MAMCQSSPTLRREQPTSNNGTSHTGPILGVVGNDIPSLFTKDVDQSLVDSVGKVGVFLPSATEPS